MIWSYLLIIFNEEFFFNVFYFPTVLNRCFSALSEFFSVFLCRIHHGQIASNRVLVPVIDSLRKHAKSRVHDLRVSEMCVRCCIIGPVNFDSARLGRDLPCLPFFFCPVTTNASNGINRSTQNKNIKLVLSGG